MAPALLVTVAALLVVFAGGTGEVLLQSPPISSAAPAEAARGTYLVPPTRWP